MTSLGFNSTGINITEIVAVYGEFMLAEKYGWKTKLALFIIYIN